MRIILGFIALMFAGAALLGATTHAQTVSGVPSDPAHIVSRETFLQALRGTGAPTTNYQQAYIYATDTCNVVMRARVTDREQLKAVYPAAIQDATLRAEVYYAINRGNVCVG